jgi:predicted aspartyl protease
MIFGKFGNDGELFFEIKLVAVTGEQFLVDVLLDTGFTTGWLAMNSQDLEALQWPLAASDKYESTTNLSLGGRKPGPKKASR